MPKEKINLVGPSIKVHSVSRLVNDNYKVTSTTTTLTG